MKLLGGQKQLRDGEEIEMNGTDAYACTETDKLSNHSDDLLNMIWKTMQEDKIELKRISRETEEEQEKNKGEEKAETERSGGRITRRPGTWSGM